jgi:hypothetical protein
LSEYTTIATFFTGIGTGLISGLLIQRKRFNDDLKTRKIDRLVPYIEHAYPIIERLKKHSEYATQLQDEESFNSIINQVNVSLQEYSKWFENFKENGMIPQLDSLDKELVAYLVGLSSFACQYKRHGIIYISQNIESLSRLSDLSENFVCQWLKK